MHNGFKYKTSAVRPTGCLWIHLYHHDMDATALAPLMGWHYIQIQMHSLKLKALDDSGVILFKTTLDNYDKTIPGPEKNLSLTVKSLKRKTNVSFAVIVLEDGWHREAPSRPWAMALSYFNTYLSSEFNLGLSPPDVKLWSRLIRKGLRISSLGPGTSLTEMAVICHWDR